MSNKKQFDEAAFRAQLNQTLQQVEVGEPLRTRTLEACRNWLEAEGSAAEPVSVPSGHAEAAPLMRRILPFAGKHAMFFRVAGGLAACMLLVLMIIDVLPRMGATESAGLPQSENFSMVAESVAADAAPAASQAAAAEAAGAVAFAKAVTGSEDLATESHGTDMAEAPLMAAQPEAESGSDTANSAAPGASGEGTSEARYGMTMAQLPWQSLQVTFSGTLPVKPGEELVRAALANSTDVAALTEGQPREAMDVSRLFAVTRLQEPLTPDTLSGDGAFEALFASAESGYWTLPILADEAALLVPLHAQANAEENGNLVATEPIPVANTGNWLQTLSGEETLRQVLTDASGGKVRDWQVLDVDHGAGFWVGWRAGGTDWVMPFLENPERMGLENLRAYQWDSLVAIVGPLL